MEREGGAGGGERGRTAVCHHTTERAQALSFISPSSPAGGGGGGTFFFPVSFRRGKKSLRVMSRVRRVRACVRSSVRTGDAPG